MPLSHIKSSINFGFHCAKPVQGSNFKSPSKYKKFQMVSILDPPGFTGSFRQTSFKCLKDSLLTAGHNGACKRKRRGGENRENQCINT